MHAGTHYSISAHVGVSICRGCFDMVDASMVHAEVSWRGGKPSTERSFAVVHPPK